MKSIKDDGGECQRKWHSTRRKNLLRLSGDPPANLCIDQLNLTVCCRYAESLMKNPRISRYLAKHHPTELQALQAVLTEFDSMTKAQSKNT